MTPGGYYRYPALYGNSIVFVSEGDLWHTTLDDLAARRLTFNKGAIKSPVFSPDGKCLAFASSDEGHSELYVMPAHGGETKRLTYMGDDLTVVGWTKEGIYFTSSSGQPFMKCNVVWRIDPTGGIPEQQNIGPANFISFKKDSLTSGAVIQRHGYREYGYWKRYRGGTAGDIWIDPAGKGDFKRILPLKGDLARPLWIGDQIVFSSDHEGVGNLYRCDVKGEKIHRLTSHADYYVRNQTTDGTNVIYHAGADLWHLDMKTSKPRKLNITYHSDRPGRSRKFFNPEQYLQSYALHPKGQHLAVVTRGKACTLGNWEGPVIQLGERDGIRYRLPTWMHDGKRLLMVSDRGGEENLVIFDAETALLVSQPNKPLDIGRVIDLWTSPTADHAILFNHRSDVLLIDLKKWTLSKVDASPYLRPSGGDWSADGRWFTYAVTIARQKMAIKLLDVKTKKTIPITNPLLMDESPCFDPEGKFIYFLSRRNFDPTYDALHFDLGFMYGTKIYAIPLQKEVTDPFLKLADSLVAEVPEEEEKDKKGKKDEKKPEVKIDLENIQKRLFEFPVPAGNYSHLTALKGKIYFISYPIEGVLEAADHNNGEGTTSLECFDFETQKTDSIAPGVLDLAISAGHEWMLTRTGKRLRVFKAGEKPEEDPKPSKKSGWIDLCRIKLMVTPPAEWRQMYQEAWRLQRDQYWVEDMSNINWKQVFKRYEPLLDRLSTRDEFTDLVWEMQGELGTSHAYVFGGDLKASPRWTVGSLGADFRWDKTKKAYKITNIAQGDYWDSQLSSPFVHAGVHVQEGDYLLEINKQVLSAETSPHELLLNRAGEVLELQVADKTLKKKRSVFVETLENLYLPRYRDWVEKNRAYVHAKSKGRVGYIHIPDMSALGYAEFHRSFLQEMDAEGLMVDVRFNGGGHVSSLLLEKLARKRIGYDVTRWHGQVPYPQDAPQGPMVCVTNEYAGSDGDMFSHSFKLMNLGPLLGKRTWGGVIGIWPRHGLVDGGVTTQPEFSFWFKDAGWSIENYGVDPDIEVEITPQDYAKGSDPQLDRALKVLDAQMKKHTTIAPDLTRRPSLKLPKAL